MKSFNDFRKLVVLEEDETFPIYQDALTEELHSELKSILNSETIDPRYKNDRITRAVRDLVKRGEDTGLVDGKPKKGSSRAVYFHSEPKLLNIDGQDVHVPTVLKVAFPGVLDRHTGHSSLLGEEQNRVEAEPLMSHHSVLRHIGGNRYETNHDGAYMPVLDSHPEGHWLEMPLAQKFSAVDFKNHTKHPEIKGGFTFKDFTNVMQTEHANANGSQRYGALPEEKHDLIRFHPYTDAAIDGMQLIGLHPNDIGPSNMGTFVHPITGHRYPVQLDYGWTGHVAKLYALGRKNKYKW